MRALVLDNASRKGMDALPDKQFRQVVTSLFGLLKDPTPADARHLVGTSFHRVTVGEYRIVYDFTDAQVRVVAFGKRNDGEVYRRMNRRT
jgi:mRNA interferase RelE/StbE